MDSTSGTESTSGTSWVSSTADDNLNKFVSMLVTQECGLLHSHWEQLRALWLESEAAALSTATGQEVSPEQVQRLVEIAAELEAATGHGGFYRTIRTLITAGGEFAEAARRMRELGERLEDFDRAWEGEQDEEALREARRASRAEPQDLDVGRPDVKRPSPGSRRVLGSGRWY